jgi:beta-glucosidase
MAVLLRRKWRSIFLVAGLAMLCAAAPVAAQTPGQEASLVDFGSSTVVHPQIWPKGKSGLDRDPAVEAKIAEIVGEMTLEEKVGQIVQADISSVTPEDVRRYHLGSILNGGSSGPYGNDRAPAADWLKLADEFYAASSSDRLGIPVIWGMDAVHGNTNIVGATIFPHNIGLGAMRDPALMEKIGEITAEEVRIVGGDWTFAPTIAVARNDRWGRTYESYSENTALVASYAKAIVEGIQGRPGDTDFLKGPHVIATAKHFIGDGGTYEGRNMGDARYTEPRLRDLFAPPYEAAISAGVQTVMASLSSWRGIKMHGSHAFLSDVLVDRLGFDGFVVGDWNGYAQLEGCNSADCPAALKAGLDMYMSPESWKALYGNLLSETKSGVVPMARLDEAVARILRVKLRAGIMGEKKPSERPFGGAFDRLGSPDHRAVARQAVRESLVLLKNENSVLPLRPTLHILVTGSGADDMSMQSGGWTISWQGDGNKRSDFPNGETIFEGIKANVEVAGGSATLSRDGRFVSRPDAAIVVFGETPYAESRGDRPDVNYQPDGRSDLRLIRQLKDKGIPVVAVFLSGRPLYVTPEINASDAFVAAWLPGSEGGGIADILFTKADGTTAYDFSGRLSFSWPRSPDESRLNVDDEPYYPLFSYGYGLSYTAPENIGILPEVETDGTARPDTYTFVKNGSPAASWHVALSIGNAGRVLVDHTPMEFSGGRLKVGRIDRFMQEDTLAFDWNGRGKASVMLLGPQVGLVRQLKEDMSLRFGLRVSTAPTGRVMVAMGGGKLGTVDVTDALRKAAGKGWATLTVRLSCLAKAGTDMNQVSMPFVFSTTGRLGLNLYEARLGAGTDKGCVTMAVP